jgi:LysM repeat protein
MDREFLLMVHDIPQVLLWMKRANRYFPFIQERLWNRGLPEDLKYVAIAESALRPNARSHARAVGLWQFISATGTRYGLRRTSWVDERRDPVKSTDAALAYLEDLYDKFGDWFLAVAAYNVGESHIKRRIKKQRTNSYFDLVLLRETERYVFRIAAAKVILSNPKKFGFDLPQDKLYQPLNVVRLEARIKRGKLDLVDFAQACGMTLRSFLDYNPHFRKSFIPRGKYTFYVLPDKKEDALSFIAKWNRSKSRNTYVASSAGGKDKTIHRVISGDSLWKIARKYQVFVKSIKEWNQLNDSNYIYPGQQLAIYR